MVGVKTYFARSANTDIKGNKGCGVGWECNVSIITNTDVAEISTWVFNWAKSLSNTCWKVVMQSPGDDLEGEYTGEVGVYDVYESEE